MNDEKRKQLNHERLSAPEMNAVLVKKIWLVIGELESAGIKPLVTCGFRSYAEQNKLYSYGRTRSGKIVTNAKGGQSKHNFGNAVDFAFIDKDGKISWDLNLFRKLGNIAKRHGLHWGGDWYKFKDFPHIEL
jgi:peptidoglycan LD-endopeptidase CwlK